MRDGGCCASDSYRKGFERVGGDTGLWSSSPENGCAGVRVCGCNAGLHKSQQTNEAADLMILLLSDLGIYIKNYLQVPIPAGLLTF